VNEVADSSSAGAAVFTVFMEFVAQVIEKLTYVSLWDNNK
jgi:hypothetical protein